MWIASLSQNKTKIVTLLEDYFKRQVELSTMYRTMENKNYNNTAQALKDLKEG